MTAKSYGYSTVSGAVEAVDGGKPKINHIRRAAKICEGANGACGSKNSAKGLFEKKHKELTRFQK